jgi:hypothetical protein
MMPAVMMPFCHCMSPFSMSRSGRISQNRERAREWVDKSVVPPSMPRGITDVMAPVAARVKMTPRLPQIPHGGGPHLGRKAALAVPAVRRVNDRDSCHSYPLIQSVTRNRPPVIIRVRPFG